MRDMSKDAFARALRQHGMRLVLGLWMEDPQAKGSCGVVLRSGRGIDRRATLARALQFRRENPRPAAVGAP